MRIINMNRILDNLQVISMILLAVAIFFVILFVTKSAFGSEIVYGSGDGSYGDYYDGLSVPVLYAMSEEVKDVGVITYNFNTNNEDMKSAFYTAFDEWQPFLQGIRFIEDLQDPNSARLQINEKKENIEYHGDFQEMYMGDTSLTLETGHNTIVGGEINLFIKGSEMKESYTLLVNLAKHEVGHALGLGHADSKKLLMYEGGVDLQQKQFISNCEAEAIEQSISDRFTGEYYC